MTGFTPDAILVGTMTPTPKDKTKCSCNSNNYRAIALSV